MQHFLDPLLLPLSLLQEANLERNITIYCFSGLYLQTVKQLLNGKAYIHRGYEVTAQILFLAW